MIYYHVDVFSKGPLTGNGLTVFICDVLPSAEIMQKIAKEMKQYETAFLCKRNEHEYDTRIFTIDEELQFAGHPILGAAASVCAQENFEKKETLFFYLPNKVVRVECGCIVTGREYECTMDQGVVSVIETIDRKDVHSLIEPIHVDEDDLDNAYPLEVCSAGLPYLIVPIKKGIEKTGVFTEHYEEIIERHGAKFVYILDINNMEGRSFDNYGLEDVATGSAAGPGGDYLVRHGICTKGKRIILHQGRFLGRPSKIVFCKELNDSMLVSGEVSILARGTFEI